MQTYTLIAYRPDGEVTCRGCRMESWSSEFINEEQLSREELIERVAKLYAEEHEPDGHKWEIIMWFPDPPEDVAFSENDPYTASILNLARFRATTLINEGETTRRTQKEIDAHRAKQAARAGEIKQLNKLREKYPEA